MGKFIKILQSIACCFVFFSICSSAVAATAKLTVQVIDVKGSPVSGAEVTFGFTSSQKSGWGVKSIGIEGHTDGEGKVSGEQETSPYVTIHVEKEGYYHSGTRYEKFTGRSLLNRWEPWNPTVEIILKKKRNPVPMFMKDTGAIMIPKLDTHVGYDLEKGDWVTPDGAGAINDLVFLCTNNYINFTNAETSCEISFSQENDGMQEYLFDENEQSYFKWPYECPNEGYSIKVLKKWMKIHIPKEGYKSNIEEKKNYLFRVRTFVDENGEIIKANYGMIKKDIQLSKTGQVKFIYYFNPDGTRNIEYDENRILFR